MSDLGANTPPIGRLAIGTRLYDGRYRLDLLLASAPHRAVYRAWDFSQQRAVTIIELATPDLERATSALDRAEPLVELEQTSPIHVVWVESTTVYIAMGLAGGQTIERIMAERMAPIAPPAAVRWITQAAEGVAALPDWHLGDVSASAMLVTAEDRVQLLGFELPLGLVTPTQVAAMLPVGAVAPELYDGRCDARSDVFGLAASLHLLLTRRLWAGPEPLDVAALAESRPDLSRGLIDAVARGLALSPSDRFPDATAFRAALLEALPGAHGHNGELPWWPTLADDLSEEPPTLVTPRGDLREAMRAEAEARGVAPPLPLESAAPAAASITPEPEFVLASLPTTEMAVALDALPSDDPTAGDHPDTAAVDLGDAVLSAIPSDAAVATDFVLVRDEATASEPPPAWAPDPEPAPVPTAEDVPVAPIIASAVAEQMIVAHDERFMLHHEHEAASGGLLARLRGVLRGGAPLPTMASATIVLPRHLVVNQTYTILVRVQCRRSQPPTADDLPVVAHLEVEATSALSLPVQRLALRVPVTGGLSEATLGVTALHPTGSAGDRMRFTFRDDAGRRMHTGEFVADVSVLTPDQIATGPMLITLAHVLTLAEPQR